MKLAILFLLNVSAAVFLASLLGLITFFVGITVFHVELLPEQRDPILAVVGLSNMAAAIGAVFGFRIGPRVFEGIVGWTT